MNLRLVPDYYATLGVRPDATPAELVQGYRLAAARTHPDRAGEGAREAFALIQEAHRVLREDRDGYDAYRKALRSQLDTRREGDDIEVTVGIGLLEMIRGGARVVSYPREVRCTECRGRGCQGCQDLGLRLKTEYQRVLIEGSVANGDILALEGLGHHGVHGGRDGTLRVQILVQHAAEVRIDGRTVHRTVAVQPNVLREGGEVNVELPDGSYRRLWVIPGKSAVRRYVLRGMGLADGTRRGDFVLSVVAWLGDKPDSARAHEMLWELEEWISGGEERQGGWIPIPKPLHRETAGGAGRGDTEESTLLP